jgi:DNA-binding PadR family transcriptional regulator
MTVMNIIIIMIVAGVLGGVVNYGLSRPEKFDLSGLLWSILIGMAAALLVPLFLNTISSTLLTGILEGTAKPSDVYVYFGFCLLGAIASKSMIYTLTNKILKTAEEAKDKVEDLEKNVSPIIIKETEPENGQDEEVQEELASTGTTARSFGLVGDDAPKIIKALGNSKYSRRTVSGVSKEAGVKTDKTIEILEWLQKNGLGFTTGAPKHYWSLTQEGRSVFAKIIKDDS